MPGFVSQADIVAAGGVTTDGVTGVVAAAIPDALPGALPAALPAVGLATTQQVSLPAGAGGAAGRPAIPDRDATRIVEGDRALRDEDINLAALVGKKLVWNPDATLSVSATLQAPGNIHTDFGHKKLTPASSLTTGAMMRLVGQKFDSALPVWQRADLALIERVWLSQPQANNRPDPTKNVDGAEIGTSGVTTDYLREMKMRDWRVEGFRYGVRALGDHNYINVYEDFHVKKNWARGFSWEAGADAGERIVFRGGSWSDTQNAQGTGTAFYISGSAGTGDFYAYSLSSSYNDRFLYLPRGSFQAYGCHVETGGNEPFVEIDTTGGAAPSAFAMFGGVIVGGPNPMGLRDAEFAVQRPALIEMRSSRVNIALIDTQVSKFNAVANCTEIIRNIRRAVPGRINLSLPLDAGVRNPGSLTANNGQGVPPAISYTMLNRLYVPPAGSLTGVTATPGSGGLITPETNIFLNSDTGSYLFDRTSPGSAQSVLFQSVGIGAGEVYEVEVSDHLVSQVSGWNGIRISYWADDAEAVQIGGNVDIAPPGALLKGGLTSGSTTLTVSALSGPALLVGDVIIGTGIPANTTIVALGTGTGGAGTYTMSAAATATVATPDAVSGSNNMSTQKGPNGVSAATATITIDNPASYPNKGTFRPGALQSGAYAIGQDLSDSNGGTILKGRCFLTKDNGDGTWECYVANDYNSQATPIPPASTIGPAVFRGWSRCVGVVRPPEGAKRMRMSLNVGAITGNVQQLTYKSRPRCWRVA